MSENRKNYTDIRCGSCGRLLARGILDAGEIEFLCRCKFKTILRAVSPDFTLLRAESPNLALRDGLHGGRNAREPDIAS